MESTRHSKGHSWERTLLILIVVVCLDAIMLSLTTGGNSGHDLVGGDGHEQFSVIKVVRNCFLQNSFIRIGQGGIFVDISELLLTASLTVACSMIISSYSTKLPFGRWNRGGLKLLVLCYLLFLAGTALHVILGDQTTLRLVQPTRERIVPPR